MPGKLKLVVAFVIIAGLFSLVGNIASIRFDLAEFLGLKAQATTANVFTSQTIVSSIQPMGQLVSISAQVAKADIFVGVQQGALNACGYSVNHVAQGTIEAGIDLN